MASKKVYKLHLECPNCLRDFVAKLPWGTVSTGTRVICPHCGIGQIITGEEKNGK